MSLCPNEREIRLKFCAHLCGRIRRHSIFHRTTVTYIQSSNACFNRKNSAMNMLRENMCLDLNVISKQVDTQRMFLN